MKLWTFIVLVFLLGLFMYYRPDEPETDANLNARAIEWDGGLADEENGGLRFEVIREREERRARAGIIALHGQPASSFIGYSLTTAPDNTRYYIVKEK